MTGTFEATDDPIGRAPLRTGRIAGWLARDESAEVRRALGRSLAIIAAATLITAWFSEVFFKPDEHWEILEFMSYKLGKTAAADLPFEFRDAIRGWIQPGLYYLIAKPLMLVGIKDVFTIVLVLRLLTALVSLAAFVLFADAMVADFAERDEKLAFARSLPVFGFLPFLFVRTSSASLSAAFFTAGLAFLMRNLPEARGRRFLAAGLLLGLAFEARYQAGLLVLGLFLWLALVARVRVASLAVLTLGGLVPVAVALPVDRWGYGYWTFPPWRYVWENLMGGVANSFGTDPFYGYAYLISQNIFLPLMVFLCIAMVVVWLRRPLHVMTWTTLPFVLIHSIIAHKEERFLFPMVMLTTAFPVLAFAPGGRRILPVVTRLWALRWSLPVKVVSAASVASMALLAVFPVGIWSHHVPMAKYVYRHFPGEFTVYSFDPVPFPDYPLYRPMRLRSTRLDSADALERLLQRGPVYLYSAVPSLADVLPADAGATLLYSELPFADHPGVAVLATRLARRFQRGREHGALLTLFRVERAPAPAGAGS